MAPNTERALKQIEQTSDPSALRQMIENARRLGFGEVEQAAFRRLIYVSPAEDPGTVEHDFWSTVHAFEHLLKQERGKTIRLARTRQKVARVGVVQTLTDWAIDTKETDGFNMLIERGMPQLTGEGIILRHSNRFPHAVVEAARMRLAEHYADEAVLWPHGRT